MSRDFFPVLVAFLVGTASGVLIRPLLTSGNAAVFREHLITTACRVMGCGS